MIGDRSRTVANPIQMDCDIKYQKVFSNIMNINEVEGTNIELWINEWLNEWMNEWTNSNGWICMNTINVIRIDRSPTFLQPLTIFARQLDISRVVNGFLKNVSSR